MTIREVMEEEIKRRGELGGDWGLLVGGGGSDSDRKCPGLSPGLLSGRVCASLSACLSSLLLSILLKTVSPLIIRTLLFWNDMFSLHHNFFFFLHLKYALPAP